MKEINLNRSTPSCVRVHQVNLSAIIHRNGQLKSWSEAGASEAWHRSGVFRRNAGPEAEFNSSSLLPSTPSLLQDICEAMGLSQCSFIHSTTVPGRDWHRKNHHRYRFSRLANESSHLSRSNRDTKWKIFTLVHVGGEMIERRRSARPPPQWAPAESSTW